MMSDPSDLKPFWNQVWVAHLDPPLFLCSTSEPMPEGGRNEST